MEPNFLLSCTSHYIVSEMESVVSGLSYDTNETVLKDAFEQHGELIEGNLGPLQNFYGSVLLLCKANVLCCSLCKANELACTSQ